MGRVRGFLLWFEESPLAVLFVAAGVTVGVVVALASYAGWSQVLRRVEARHSWAWLGVCLAAEAVAYLGYMLTIRDVARVDGGAELDLMTSIKTVIHGFGVFAATRTKGGFTVDYSAFRRAGAGKRDATARVLALGFLEYAILGLAALVASVLLFLRVDGHRTASTTLPSLIIVPCIAAAIWVTSPKRAARLARTPRDSGRLRTGFANTVAGTRKLRSLLSSPREHGLAPLGMSLYWAGDIACLWAALQLVGGRHITIAALVLAYTTGYVLTRRSLPGGGAGIVEAALTIALYWMGLRLVPALIGTIVYRIFNFWLPIIPALILLRSTERNRSPTLTGPAQTDGS